MLGEVQLRRAPSWAIAFHLLAHPPEPGVDPGRATRARRPAAQIPPNEHRNSVSGGRPHSSIATGSIPPSMWQIAGLSEPRSPTITVLSPRPRALPASWALSPTRCGPLRLTVRRGEQHQPVDLGPEAKGPGPHRARATPPNGPCANTQLSASNRLSPPVRTPITMPSAAPRHTRWSRPSCSPTWSLWLKPRMRARRRRCRGGAGLALHDLPVSQFAATGRTPEASVSAWAGATRARDRVLQAIHP